MKRRELREATFLLLFRNDFFKQEEMEGQIELYLERPELITISDEEKQEVRMRAAWALRELPELDLKIEEAAEGWKVSRMGKVELTIIRLALFEILHDDQVPPSVAINEAVELAKKFGGDDSPSFINGILAKLV